MQKRDDYRLVLKAAGDVGIQVEITGELPKDNPAAKITVCAISECITNTIRHAHGKKICIEVCKDEMYTIILSNDGIPPNGEIEETGGLKNLREMTENFGGRMMIQSVPEFKLTLMM